MFRTSLLFGFLCLTACAQQSQQPITQYDYCLTEEAQESIGNGTISAGPLRTTVDQMIKACVPVADQTPALTEHAKDLLIRLLQDEV